MTEKEQIHAKIKQVIAGAAQLRDEEFRLILEGLVKKGGKDAQMLLVHFITSPHIEADARENIIRTTGYIQSPLYLVPLKKIIDHEPRLPLKKAAVLALSKYNNQQALNVLNASLQNIGNPFLLKTINEQISLIKKNNPILGLLPKFLLGDKKDVRSFMVIVDILKKILQPEDVKIFANYLKSEELSIRTGSFEILCQKGDRTHQTYILNFYYNRLQPDEKTAAEPTVPPPDKAEQVTLTKQVKHYFLRFPALILTQLRRLNGLYAFTQNEEVKKLIIGVLCHSRAPQALTFIKQIYDSSDPQFKEVIIEESSGNELAVDFLFEKYQSGKMLKDKVIKALLNSRKGFEYFAQHFNDFDDTSKEMVVKSLPQVIRPQMVPFIKTIFQSGSHKLIKVLLRRIRDNFLFSFQEILFAPDRIDELLKIEKEYLDAIALLFPVRTVRLILEKLATSEMEVARAKRLLAKAIEICKQEFIITLRDSSILEVLVLKVINASSLELNELLLKTFEKLKTLDRGTYKGILDACNMFDLQRGDNLVEEETYGMKRVRDNLQNIIEDVRRIDTLEKEVRLVLAKAVPDLNQLKRVIETFHLGAAFKIKTLIRFIAEYMQDMDEKYMPLWREFFKGFPIITQMVREARQTLAQTEGKSITPEGESFQDKLRIIIRCKEKYLTALFKDQFNELLPDFNIVADPLQMHATDILLCDTPSLKEYMENNRLNSKRIFLIMDNRQEYNAFKALTPKTFTQPISIYRIVKMILSELYLTRK
jgi:hypothetical protein